MGILSRGNHAREPVERRVRVSAAEAFNKGADNVVMVVAVAVVENDLLLDAFFRGLEVNLNAGSLGRRPCGNGGLDGELEGVEEASSVTRGRVDEMLEGAGGELDLPSPVAALPIGEGGARGGH